MERPLILLSNRGPVTFERDDSGELVTKRGGGGLVTALTGLLRQRDALWIASAMTPEDMEASRSHGGEGFEVELDGPPTGSGWSRRTRSHTTATTT